MVLDRVIRKAKSCATGNTPRPGAAQKKTGKKIGKKTGHGKRPEGPHP